LSDKEIFDFIDEIYKNDKEILFFLIPHIKSVADLAVKIAKEQKADVDFVHRASLLHDIAILMTNVPKIHCKGSAPYIQHGILGKKLLEEHGYIREASVAQTHIGVGISANHIIKNKLPLPPIDMIPATLEEEIISYADLFFSKRPKTLTIPKTIEEVIHDVKRYGDDSYEIFEKWHKKFSI
jgi:uncharacterized protein